MVLLRFQGILIFAITKIYSYLLVWPIQRGRPL
jgi:hypothetical protein